MNPEDNGLGRLYLADLKDKKFTIQSILPVKAAGITSRYWNDNGWWGDQGQTPYCVGFSWAHWLEDGPVEQPGEPPILKPIDIYKAAQSLDDFPGTDYDGTTVRAGAKFLQDKGFITEYRWAWDVNTLVQAVLQKGPVVVGTNWYYNMFFPSRTGVIKLGGALAGGHAYVINGVNTVSKLFRIKNSWGRTWGQTGHAYISFADMSRLINEQGEICLATEITKVLPPKVVDPIVNKPTPPTPSVTNTGDVIGKVVYSIQHKQF